MYKRNIQIGIQSFMETKSTLRLLYGSSSIYSDSPSCGCGGAEVTGEALRNHHIRGLSPGCELGRMGNQHWGLTA